MAGEVRRQCHEVAAASVATEWSEPVSGRELHPLESSAFHVPLFRQLGSEIS
jgi:hypothetical protein